MVFNPDAELDLVDLYYATEGTKYLALALCTLLVCETFATLPAGDMGSHNACHLRSQYVKNKVLYGNAELTIADLKASSCITYLIRCLAYWLFYIYGSMVIQIIVASVLIARIWAIYQLK
ncbi:transmembrane protein, putative, partial [Rhizoctonia solani AG-3 Rhs1AP]